VEWALKEERRKSTEWPKCYGSSKIGRIILGGCGGNEKRDYQYLVGNSLDYDFSLTERNVLQLATKAGVGSLIWPSLRGDLSSEKLSAANIRRKFR
jgi:hypothetical protein